jgi:hypothetical protein|tara:strand:+ start:265 stop:627 length:363 start_codon:yes stop_codon:yes gene_type:complete
MFKLKKGVFMNNYKNWTEIEFKAYLCLYAADSNFEYNADERELIESKFDIRTIEKVKSETDDLDDHQRSSIISQYIRLKKYNQKNIDEMLSEIEEVYLADGIFDKYEQSIFRMLKKIMKA